MKKIKQSKTRKGVSPAGQKIHKKMTFMELMKEDKDAAMYLAEKGMFCCGCPMALTETIEQGAQAHGIVPEELVTELNSKKKSKRSNK